MKPYLSPIKLRLGQSLVEILIAIAVFSILAQAIFTLVSSSFQVVSSNRARITARHLAQEKIEFIRNLPYNNVGTVGGIPSGPLPQTESVQRNGLNFSVKTTVVYMDDPFDQQAPDDLLPTDYKSVRVEVSWQGLAASSKNPIVLVTNIAPKGVETTAGGGTLSILVFDANSLPVPQADVTIVANETNPKVNLVLKTADNGRIILPGALPCDSCYQISVTKSGYTLDRTYSTSEIANPSKPQPIILQGKLIEVSFTIDKVSTLAITSTSNRENNFSPLPNTTFHMRGGKTLGTDVNSQQVYKFDKNLTTNEAGSLTISNLEWDSYQITLPDGSGWDFSGTNPFLPLSISPNTNSQFSFALSTHTNNSLLATFTDSSKTQIASVSARLSDGATYEATSSSGLATNPDFGQVSFSNLSAKNYLLEATASGFLDTSVNIPVSGQTQETVILTPQ